MAEEGPVTNISLKTLAYHADNFTIIVVTHEGSTSGECHAVYIMVKPILYYVIEVILLLVYLRSCWSEYSASSRMP